MLGVKTYRLSSGMQRFHPIPIGSNTLRLTVISTRRAANVNMISTQGGIRVARRCTYVWPREDTSNLDWTRRQGKPVNLGSLLRARRPT